ncbi:MAG TPA: hypothetical protein VE912_11300 [Bacteroidales bacterium]|nr:hypothetical protein [Bacteroidales bacterium]
MMKRLIMLSVAVFLTFSAFAQDQDSKEVITDTIFRLGGRTILADVNQVTPIEVQYKFPGDDKVYSIDRKQIQRIVYKNGRVEVYNKPVLQMIGENQWEAVLVTEKEEDVEGLYKYGVVKSNAASSSRSKKAARRSATIRLQKRAANMGANIILITNAEAKGGYGEIPGYEMEGIAYGYNPPAEEKEGDGEEK